MKSQPALVYTTTGTTRVEINEYLASQRLYRYDDVQEADNDVNRPSAERPILRRNMLFGSIAGAQKPDTADDLSMPGVFVADHLSSLGPDWMSQVAVVGVLMDFGLRVYADYGEIDGNWYVGQVRALGFPRLDHMMESLRHMKVEDAGESGLLATTWSRGWSQAGRRARELVDQDGLTFTQAAPILTVEGYHNSKFRVQWYTKAVRRAYKAAP